MAWYKGSFISETGRGEGKRGDDDGYYENPDKWDPFTY
jgi:hypothetical protein